MNRSHTLGQQGRLRLPDSTRQCLQLSIDIRQTDVIEIHQSQTANGGTRQ
jgi:hypothetical protein